MRGDEKIEGEEKEVIDLTTHPELRGRDTVIIEVGGRLWRVLKHALETRPGEYINAWIGVGIVSFDGHPWRCCRCGQETEEHYSVWTSIADVLCDACREAGGGVPRHCAYCHQPLVPLLPFEVAGSQRIVLACPLHHCFAIVEEEETE